MTRALWYLAPAALLLGCTVPQETLSDPAPNGSPMRVRVVAAQQRDSAVLYEATGTVQAKSSVAISSRWMGYVRELRVNVGDRVRPGQLLISLDARELEAGTMRAGAAREEIRGGIPEADSAVVSAKANLTLAQSTFRRMADLYQKKSISDQEYDEASARLKASEAAYEMARARRTQIDSRLLQADQELRTSEIAHSYATIEAPVAGIVIAKNIEAGNMAVPGATLLTIEREAYRLEAPVEESRIAGIRTGQEVSVTLDAVAQVIHARVSEIVPAVDAASRTNIVKIDLPASPAIRSGQFGRAGFQVGRRAVLEVPAAAVRDQGQIESVFVEENGIAHLRIVTLGAKDGDLVEVLTGLNPGERVILPAGQTLADGIRVEASN